MTPFETAKALRGDTFEDELEAHLRHGFVFSTPTAFLVGRPVNMLAEHALIADVWHQFPPEECQAWLVWLFAGDLAAVIGMIPYRLPFLAWARREGELRFYRFDDVIGRISKRYSVGANSPQSSLRARW